MRKNFSIDSLRILASFAVVVIHVSSFYIQDRTVFNSNSWLFASVFNSFSRWSVPIFILISGSLLINDQSHQEIGVFFKKRIEKILPPLIFWTIFFMMFSTYTTGYFSLKDIILRLFIGETYYHLWYLFLIVGLYAVTPFISLIYSNFSKKVRVNGIIIIFVAAAINSFYCRYFGQNQQFFFFKFLPYLGYFLAGKELINSKIPFSRYIYLVMWLLASILIAAITALMIHFEFKITTLFYDYLNPLVIIQSISFYVFIIKAMSTVKLELRFEAGISFLSSLTFGIYIIHPLFINLILAYKTHFLYWQNAFFEVPFFSIIVFIMSALVTYLFTNITFMKRFVYV